MEVLYAMSMRADVNLHESDSRLVPVFDGHGVQAFFGIRSGRPVEAPRWAIQRPRPGLCDLVFMARTLYQRDLKMTLYPLFRGGASQNASATMIVVIGQ